MSDKALIHNGMLRTIYNIYKIVLINFISKNFY